MNLPSGLVFFLDFKYGTAQPGFDVVSGVSRDGSGTLHGQTNTSGNPSGGLYGSGRFVYSINEASSDSIIGSTYFSSVTLVKLTLTLICLHLLMLVNFVL